MKNEKLRIGLVGLGRFVEIAHLPCYFRTAYSPHIELAGICDLNPERLKELAPKCRGARQFADHREMFAKAGLDAAVVVTPDHAHTRIVLDALDAGLDVLVEKPLTMTVAEAVQIIERAGQLRRLVVVDFHKRLDPSHMVAREKVLSGAYGEVQTGYSWMQDTINVPCGGFFRSDLAARSSPLWFLGVHIFDGMRFITALEPVEVRATAYKDEVADRGVDTYDTVKADFVMNNGASVTFVMSWNLPNGAPAITIQGVTLQCSRGKLDLDTCDRGVHDLSGDGYKYLNTNFLMEVNGQVRGFGVESIGEALTAIRAHRRKPVDLGANPDLCARNGLYATLMGQATEVSLAKGQKMRSGRVLVGSLVRVNDLLIEQVGPDRAKPFLVQAK
jgi:predicted dehydrogenase